MINNASPLWCLVIFLLPEQQPNPDVTKRSNTNLTVLARDSKNGEGVINNASPLWCLVIFLLPEQQPNPDVTKRSNTNLTVLARDSKNGEGVINNASPLWCLVIFPSARTATKLATRSALYKRQLWSICPCQTQKKF